MKTNPKSSVLIFSVVSLIVFGLLSNRLYNDETQAIVRGFNAVVDQRATAFEREVLLNLEILNTLRTGLSVLPEVSRDTFTRFDKCLAAIEALEITAATASNSRWVTVSAGVCTAIPRSGEKANGLTGAADKALYVAKQQGRRQVRTGEYVHGEGA